MNHLNYFYFIFGEYASRAYHERMDVKDVITHIIDNKGDGCIHFHDDEMDNPMDLLERYDGWGGYAVIDKDEYEQLKEAGVTLAKDR